MSTRLNLEQKNKSEIVKHIESLSAKLKGCGLSENRLAPAHDSITKLATYMGVTSLEAILFTAVLSLNFKKHPIHLNQLADFLGVPGIKMMQYISALTVLQQKRWIRAEHKSIGKRSVLSEISYFVTNEVFSKLNNKPESKVPNEKKDIHKVLAEVMELADDFYDDKINYSEMMEDIKELIEHQSDLPFIEQIKKQGLTEAEELLFMLVCQRTILGDEEVDLDKLVHIVMGSSYDGLSLKRSIAREQNRMIKLDLINLQAGMFRNDHQVVLTDHAIRLYFPEDIDIMLTKNVSSGNITKAESINQVELYFNQKEKLSLDRLKKLLTSKEYKGVTKRMKRQGLRSGFQILLHGAPGTGKTEAVNQIARATGRDVMKIDLSKTKSMWFGESEKKIAAIFSQYRQIQKYAPVTPILLFNEADGIFGARSTNMNNGSSQTQNTIQNILLDEMENFEGILIATTNLTQNFDKAFERRFLYKIEFSKPGIETRKLIWKSKIPELSEELATQLSQEFDFSGGQIENVSRKFTIDKVLSRATATYKVISSYCKEEQLHKNASKCLGFQRGNSTRAI